MREPSEMVKAPRMQSMVQNRQEKHLFRDQKVFAIYLFLLVLGLSASRAPAQGP